MITLAVWPLGWVCGRSGCSPSKSSLLSFQFLSPNSIYQYCIYREKGVNFRSDINGLRAIAVIAVVLFHFKVAGFSGGFVGVDIFL